MNQVALSDPCLKSANALTQGAQAVASGRAAEDLIYCLLKERGYSIRRQEAVGTNIYGGQTRADFYIEGTPVFPNGLIIESKWQESMGSVDEKYPYLVENIKSCYPAPTIVVIGGAGIREGAEQWLRDQVDGDQLYAVFSMEEFLTWTIRNL